MTRCHKIALQMADWWEAYGQDHESQDWQEFLDHYVGLLQEKAAELGGAHVNLADDGTPTFGMSNAAGCVRAATLRLLGAERERPDGETRFTWWMGHQYEVTVLATLLAMGFDIRGSQERIVYGPMVSYLDGIIDASGEYDSVLSVKSQGYKFSSKRGGKIVRQGFASLAFEGVLQGQPYWWAQLQAEMAATGLSHGLVVVAAKDIVKNLKGDPYLPSLTFWAEEVKADPDFQKTLLKVWTESQNKIRNNEPGEPLVYVPRTGYVTLPSPADTESWGGPNQKATGTFNPCFGCDVSAPCSEIHTG
jgi:hypothetical protein